MEEEFGDSLEIEWRSFLLRPRPREKRNLASFARYTESWLRPAAEPDAPSFRVWQGSDLPQSIDHSSDAFRIQRQSIQQGIIQPIGSTGIQVLAILGNEFMLFLYQVIGNGIQGVILARRIGRSQQPGCRSGTATQIMHIAFYIVTAHLLRIG